MSINCICILTYLLRICISVNCIKFLRSSCIASSAEITLFAFCLPFFYSFCASFLFSFFHFPYCIFFSLTASATSSFHHRVSLCLHGPFDIPHMSWAVSIIHFNCCRCSFTSRPFHFAFSTLSLTMHLYSSHVFSSLSFHTIYSWLELPTSIFVTLN